MLVQALAMCIESTRAPNILILFIVALFVFFLRRSLSPLLPQKHTVPALSFPIHCPHVAGERSLPERLKVTGNEYI
ncbi:hypothetical protein LY78DRAFT_106881 [Colletotrichum sublineola]|nr:hypothetical protein LY78DRAFT_106881 [Colletotrichum sublineola]